MNWKKEIYEWIFILTATAVMIIGAVHNYNGKILSAAGVFANGAFLFAFMSWCELRKARCKDSAEN